MRVFSALGIIDMKGAQVARLQVATAATDSAAA